MGQAADGQGGIDKLNFICIFAVDEAFFLYDEAVPAGELYLPGGMGPCFSGSTADIVCRNGE